MLVSMKAFGIEIWIIFSYEGRHGEVEPSAIVNAAVVGSIPTQGNIYV